MLFTTERTKDTKNKLKEKFFLPFVLFGSARIILADLIF